MLYAFAVDCNIGVTREECNFYNFLLRQSSPRMSFPLVLHSPSLGRKFSTSLKCFSLHKKIKTFLKLTPDRSISELLCIPSVWVEAALSAQQCRHNAAIRTPRVSEPLCLYDVTWHDVTIVCDHFSSFWKLERIDQDNQNMTVLCWCTAFNFFFFFFA